MIAVATKHTNVYIDTSAYVARRYPPELVNYLKRHGSRKVLFGSNYPMLTPARCLEGFDELELDEEVKALFLHGNAQRIFKLYADARQK
jgi:predicted TIM-barrel fold metal-dependent hydrolase